MKKNKSFKKLLFWISIAIIFNIYIFIARGQEAGIAFLGGYVIELSLSVDNLFLFLMIFSSFNVPTMYQERVLKYGILAAIILRFIFIALGVKVIERFQWITYLFGVLVLLSGIKMMISKEENSYPKDSIFVKIAKKIMPVTNELHGENFFVFKDRRIYATPLLVILVLIEGSDVIFALDSIPSIFSITTDTFIVYTSNIFAILGLRSMYNILAYMHNVFRYMKYGVALVLMFTGIKLSIVYLGIYISTLVSVLIILIILLSSILLSLIVDEIQDKFRRIKNYKKNRKYKKII